MKPIVAFLLLLVFPEIQAQEILRKPLRGKITAGTSQLKDIFVINHSANDAVQVQQRGYFTIDAAVGDTLLFSSTRFNARQWVVKSEDFDGDLVLVALEPMIRLDEVVVENYSNINAVSLGIISPDQKKYTPAERKLKTAGELKPQQFLGLLGGAMATDPIINAISGRTAQLKKELKIEKKEAFMKQVEALFDEDYFTGQLKIPAIYVKGFLFYIVENDSFTRALPERNVTVLQFLMSGLADKYKQTINE